MTAFGVWAAYCKALTVLGVIHKINSCITKIINGYIVNNNLDAVGFKRGIDIAEIIIQCHAKINATATAARNIYA